MIKINKSTSNFANELAANYLPLNDVMSNGTTEVEKVAA